jgi:hypothetical protein
LAQAEAALAPVFSDSDLDAAWRKAVLDEASMLAIGDGLNN